MSEKILITKCELAAVILIAAFIFFPFIAAPSYCIANSVNGIANHAVCEKEWQRIIAGTTFTDWLLALIGFGQLAVISVQAAIYSKQTDLLEAQHIATHRPKVILRQARMVRMPDEESLTIRFIIANVGQTQAINVNCRFSFAVLNPGIRFIGPPAFTDARTYPTPFAPGDFVTETYREPDPLGSYIAEDIRQGVRIAVFFGEISYLDEAGNRRRTGFAREYDHTTKRLVISGDPDNEYED